MIEGRKQCSIRRIVVNKQADRQFLEELIAPAASVHPAVSLSRPYHSVGSGVVCCRGYTFKIFVPRGTKQLGTNLDVQYCSKSTSGKVVIGNSLK